MSPQSSCLANADTGSTGHFLALRDRAFLTNVKIADHPVSVMLPDGSFTTSSHTAYLPWTHIPQAARKAHIFPAFPGSLVSIGLLCDCGLTATYDADKVIIRDGPKIVISGSRDKASRLWMIDLSSCYDNSEVSQLESNDIKPSLPQDEAAAVSIAPATLARVASFYHAAMFSPSINTFCTAIERGYINLPGLSANIIKQYMPPSIVTAKGHLDQARQGQHSTRTVEIYDKDTDDWYPVP